MSRRDWAIVLVLTVAALAVGWPNFRESSLGLLLTGRCDYYAGSGRRGAGCVEDPELREQRRRGGWP